MVNTFLGYSLIDFIIIAAPAADGIDSGDGSGIEFCCSYFGLLIRELYNKCIASENDTELSFLIGHYSLKLKLFATIRGKTLI